MKSRRTIIIVALVLAGLGTILLLRYAWTANERALAEQAPVEVLVARGQIPAGTEGATAAQGGLFTSSVVPASAVVAGALGPADVAALSGQIALETIYPGEQIIQDRWSASGGLTGGLTIPEGQQAISLELGDAERVGGFVRPGSTVAIYATTGSGTGVVVPSAPVLAVGATTLAPSEEGVASSVPTTIVTVALDTQDAARIIQARQTGTLTLTLVPEGTEVTEGATVTDATVLSGGGGQ